MQLLRRLLCILALAVPLAAHAAVVIAGSGVPAFWIALTVWLGFQERPVVPVSPHHMSAPPPKAKDACAYVAGVRHCPLPKLSEPQ